MKFLTLLLLCSFIFSKNLSISQASTGQEIFSTEGKTAQFRPTKPTGQIYVFNAKSPTLEAEVSRLPLEVAKEIKHLLVEENRQILAYYDASNDPSFKLGQGIILTPTSWEDYKALSSMAVQYERTMRSQTKMVYLMRNYPDEDTVYTHLKEVNEKRASLDNPLQPLFFVLENTGHEGDDEPIEQFEGFLNSIQFTILLVPTNLKEREEIKVVGDIWLGNIDTTKKLCLHGTTERTTFIGLGFQSSGIGQRAVTIFNLGFLRGWLGKEVVPINYNQGEPIIFDGGFGYVYYTNFQSIGNNLNSGSVLVGLSDKNYLMFRAPSPYCTRELIDRDAQEHNKFRNLESLRQIVDHLYPSTTALEQAGLSTEPYEISRSHYIADPLYDRALTNFKSFVASSGQSLKLLK